MQGKNHSLKPNKQKFNDDDDNSWSKAEDYEITSRKPQCKSSRNKQVVNYALPNNEENEVEQCNTGSIKKTRKVLQNLEHVPASNIILDTYIAFETAPSSSINQDTTPAEVSFEIKYKSCHKDFSLDTKDHKCTSCQGSLL